MRSVMTRVPEIVSFENLPGKGVRGVCGGTAYFAGNLDLLRSNNIEPSDELLARAGEWLAQARTVIWFADSTRALAAVAVTDRIKPTSAEAVAKLHHMGIRTVMLTGDNEASARAVALQAGIDEFHAGPCRSIAAGQGGLCQKTAGRGP